MRTLLLLLLSSGQILSGRENSAAFTFRWFCFSFCHEGFFSGLARVLIYCWKSLHFLCIYNVIKLYSYDSKLQVLVWDTYKNILGPALLEVFQESGSSDHTKRTALTAVATRASGSTILRMFSSPSSVEMLHELPHLRVRIQKRKSPNQPLHLQADPWTRVRPGESPVRCYRQLKASVPPWSE